MGFFIFESAGRDKSHKYLENSNKYIEGRIPFASLLLAEQYLPNKNKTLKGWKEDKTPAVLKWENKKENRYITSEEVNYIIFLKYIKDNKYFDNNRFKLPTLMEEFLDLSTHIGVATHSTNRVTIQTPNVRLWNSNSFLGENYPITPSLSREGIIVSSFLNQLLNRVAKNRELIVKNSNNIFSIDWIFSFKDLINDIISSLEIAMHLIYNKAQFDPIVDWNFDVTVLGSKHGRRFMDKLKWVSQISGKHLNIEKYRDSLLFIKELRNHLNHFDPPVFCMAIEEIADVLNYIIDIGMIHIEIRKNLNLKISNTLINFVLQPKIVFVPEGIYSHRKPLDHSLEGYNSCRWPNDLY